jgi:formate dehydrogenase subunit gamma
MQPHIASLQDRLTEILAQHLSLEGPLLPILHAVQAEWGHIPDESLPIIADALNISRAEVHGVVTFYHDFRAEPAGRHVLRVCRAEACQAMGANALVDHVQAVLGVDWHGTTPDGAVTLEPVFCLGLCACGPAVMLDGAVVGRITPQKLDGILAGSRT